MNKKKGQVVRGALLILVIAAVFAFVWALSTGKAPKMQTSDDFTPVTVDGHFPQDRVNRIVALWNKNNTSFWTKGRYKVDPVTERDSIIYEVALRIDVGAPTASSQAMIESRINLMLWGLVRTTLLGQNEQSVPAFIQVVMYLYIGDAPVTDSNISYVFPGQNFQSILQETDPEKIIEYAGIPKPVIPAIPNVGPLWEPQLVPLVPNK